MIAPKCLFCGVPIDKQSRVTYFRDRPLSRFEEEENARPTGFKYVQVAALPKSQKGAQQLLADQILTVRRSKDGRSITAAHTWDGKSYKDPFFCNGAHAKKFAYRCAVDQFLKGEEKA